MVCRTFEQDGKGQSELVNHARRDDGAVISRIHELLDVVKATQLGNVSASDITRMTQLVELLEPPSVDSDDDNDDERGLTEAEKEKKQQEKAKAQLAASDKREKTHVIFKPTILQDTYIRMVKYPISCEPQPGRTVRFRCEAVPSSNEIGALRYTWLFVPDHEQPPPPLPQDSAGSSTGPPPPAAASAAGAHSRGGRDSQARTGDTFFPVSGRVVKDVFYINKNNGLRVWEEPDARQASKWQTWMYDAYGGDRSHLRPEEEYMPEYMLADRVLRVSSRLLKGTEDLLIPTVSPVAHNGRYVCMVRASAIETKPTVPTHPRGKKGKNIYGVRTPVMAGCVLSPEARLSVMVEEGDDSGVGVARDEPSKRAQVKPSSDPSLSSEEDILEAVGGSSICSTSVASFGSQARLAAGADQFANAALELAAGTAASVASSAVSGSEAAPETRARMELDSKMAMYAMAAATRLVKRPLWIRQQPLPQTVARTFPVTFECEVGGGVDYDPPLYTWMREEDGVIVKAESPDSKLRIVHATVDVSYICAVRARGRPERVLSAPVKLTVTAPAFFAETAPPFPVWTGGKAAKEAHTAQLASNHERLRFDDDEVEKGPVGGLQSHSSATETDEDEENEDKCSDAGSVQERRRDRAIKGRQAGSRFVPEWGSTGLDRDQAGLRRHRGLVIGATPREAFAARTIATHLHEHAGFARGEILCMVALSTTEQERMCTDPTVPLGARAALADLLQPTRQNVLRELAAVVEYCQKHRGVDVWLHCVGGTTGRGGAIAVLPETQEDGSSSGGTVITEEELHRVFYSQLPPECLCLAVLDGATLLDHAQRSRHVDGGSASAREARAQAYGWPYRYVLSKPWQQLDNLRTASAAHAVALPGGTRIPRARLFELSSCGSNRSLRSRNQAAAEGTEEEAYTLSARLLTAIGNVASRPQQRLSWEMLLRELLPADAASWRHDSNDAASARAWRREQGPVKGGSLYRSPYPSPRVAAPSSNAHVTDEDGLPLVRSTVPLSSATLFCALASTGGGIRAGEGRGGVGAFARSAQSGRHFMV